MKNHILAFVIVAAGLLSLSASARAQDLGVGGANLVLPGFYGGVSLREQGRAGTGLDFGGTSSPWAKFALPGSDDATGGALMYGGYRFGTDIAVEAALGQSAAYALGLGGGNANGLSFGSAPGISVTAPRSWNLDVYTSYNFGNAFALYGRMGYLQQDVLPVYLGAAGSGVRGPDGFNYGVGVRYDMSPALGLKLEYARFGRPGFDSFSGPAPDSDQVRLGVQYRF